MNHELLNYQCKLLHSTRCTLSVGSASGLPSHNGSSSTRSWSGLADQWNSGPVDQWTKSQNTRNLYSRQTELSHFSHNRKLNVIRHVIFVIPMTITPSLRSAVIGRTENRFPLHGCVMVMKGVMCFCHVSCLLILLVQDASNVVWKSDTEFIIFWKGTDANSSGMLGSPVPIKSSCEVWRQTNEGCVCRVNKWCNSPTRNSWVWKGEALVGSIFPPANVYTSVQLYLGQF
jgi:hypothetical protein